MSVLKGLQDLLIKMGGTPASGDNTDETVQKIAEAYNPSSGAGVLVVHATENEAGTALVLDKTWQEIKDASATSVVVFERDGTDFSYLFLCVHTTLGGEKWRASFFTVGETYSFETTDGANAYPEYIY